VLKDYIFLIDDTNKGIDMDNNVKFEVGDWVPQIFKNFHRYGKEKVNITEKLVSEYNGNENFLLTYNCCWHQDWYTSLRKINDKILNAVKEGKGKLIFMNHLEGQPLVSDDSNLNFLEPMYKELNRLQIPPQSIIYITANAVAEKYHNDWCVENNITDKMNILGIYTDAITAQYWSSMGRLNKHTFDEHLNILKNKTNVKHFIKVQRNDRHFKTIPTHYLWSKGLQDTLYTSHTEYARHNIGYPTTQDDKTREWLFNLLDTKDDFRETLPYTIEETCKEQIKSFDSDRDYTKKIYTLNLFNMYTSSWPLWKDTIFMRMGLFWHMWEYQPFLLYSNVGSLKNLKERGYETFSEIFDESYDNINDNGLRLKMVCEEMEKISRLSLDDSFNLYESVKDKMIHNRNQLEKNIELERFLEFFYEAI